MSEGYFRFLCPHCGEMHATVSPRNNLRPLLLLQQKHQQHHDLLMTLDYTFRDAVALLERMLNRHQAKQPKGETPVP